MYLFFLVVTILSIPIMMILPQRWFSSSDSQSSLSVIEVLLCLQLLHRFLLYECCQLIDASLLKELNADPPLKSYSLTLLNTRLIPNDAYGMNIRSPYLPSPYIKKTNNFHRALRFSDSATYTVPKELDFLSACEDNERFHNPSDWNMLIKQDAHYSYEIDFCSWAILKLAINN